MQRRNVLFPEPEGPIKHVTSPRATVMLTPLQHLDAGVRLAHADRLHHRLGHEPSPTCTPRFVRYFERDAPEVASRRRCIGVGGGVAQCAIREVTLEIELSDREDGRDDQVPQARDESAWA